MRSVRIAVALAVPALLVGSLTACSSSSKSSTGSAAPAGASGAPTAAAGGADFGTKAALIESAAVMQKAGSANVTLSSGDSSSGNGNGVYAWGTKPALDLAEQESGKNIKFRLVNGDSYLGVADAQAALLGGKHWVNLDAGGGTGIGDPFTALAVLMDPTAELTVAAQNGTLSKVGSEQVAGTATTHYRSTMQAADLVGKMSNLSDAQRKAALQVITDGGSTATIDFWVDGKHQLLQMSEQNVAGSSSGAAGSGAGSNASTIKYSDLGVKVSVSAPAASDQADPAAAAKLLGSLG